MSNEIIEKYLSESDAPFGFGCSEKGDINKNGHVYHVIQQGSNREDIYYGDAGVYRHNLLGRLCSKYNAVVIFSVVMPNHTHDVIMAKSWDDVSAIFKTLNGRISHYLRKRNPKRYPNGRRIFNSRPQYKAVTDIVYLFYLGKYIYDNPLPLASEGRFVPYSCFTTMEKGYIPSAYVESLYVDLFGMTCQQMCRIYSQMSKKEVLAYARKRFSSWTQADNDAVFKVNPSIDWGNGDSWCDCN